MKCSNADGGGKTSPGAQPVEYLSACEIDALILAHLYSKFRLLGIGVDFSEPLVMAAKVRKARREDGMEILSWQSTPVLMTKRERLSVSRFRWTICTPEGEMLAQCEEISKTTRSIKMASEKKVLLAFTTLGTEQLLHSEHAGIQKVCQKGTIAPLFVQSDLKKEAGAGALSGQAIWEAAKENGFQVGDLSEEADMFIIDADSEAALGDAISKASEMGGKKLLVVIMNKESAIFFGPGVGRGVKLDKAIPATTIAPTVAYLADFALPAQVEAPVAYSVLKELNFKMKEFHKIYNSMNAMMTSLERGNRQPWDKHDCA